MIYNNLALDILIKVICLNNGYFNQHKYPTICNMLYELN